ncbi:MAG: tRNA 2-selenouridine(34) synthase MnmH [Pseudomonadota bacterium]
MSRLPEPFFETPAITPEQFLAELPRWILLDVRSPAEFGEGHLPGAWNCPVLEDLERHQVGLKYKQEGQQAAIDLGVELVWSAREGRANEWLRRALSGVTGERRILVSCWRGGLRSLLAASWVAEVLKNNPDRYGQVSVSRLAGGYKAVRGKLLEAISAPRDMVVLSGMTGSGKTALLHDLIALSGFDSRRVIDLERLARHRGSSFGHAVSEAGERIEQPSQQFFENQLGLQVLQGASGPLVVEDESTLIGKISIPLEFRRQMRAAPVVVVETPIDLRARAIFREYVSQPLEQGCEVESLWQVLAENISALERRLGGQDTREALLALASGKACPREFAAQDPWIRTLLEKYYDRAYAQSGRLAERNVIFRGDLVACRNFLKDYGGE